MVASNDLPLSASSKHCRDAIIPGWFVPPFSLGAINSSFVGFILNALGLGSIALGTALVAYGLHGKFNTRDRIVSLIA